MGEESAVDWSKSESASLTECAKHADGSIDTHIINKETTIIRN